MFIKKRSIPISNTKAHLLAWVDPQDSIRCLVHLLAGKTHHHSRKHSSNRSVRQLHLRAWQIYLVTCLLSTVGITCHHINKQTNVSNSLHRNLHRNASTLESRRCTTIRIRPWDLHLALSTMDHRLGFLVLDTDGTTARHKSRRKGWGELSWTCMVMRVEQAYVEAQAAPCLATDDSRQKPVHTLDDSSTTTTFCVDSSLRTRQVPHILGPTFANGWLYDYQARHDRCSDI